MNMNSFRFKNLSRPMHEFGIVAVAVVVVVVLLYISTVSNGTAYCLTAFV